MKNPFYSEEKPEQKTERSMAEVYLEDQAMVIQAIHPNKRGRVRLHGVSWLATANEYIPVGTDEQPTWVEIIAHKSNVLIVRQVKC